MVVFQLKLPRCPHSLAPTLVTLPSSLALPRACASYLAALPSTRAIPDRDVFYVALPTRSILVTRHATRRMS